MVVRFFDVGQGDGALIQGPAGEQVIIDGGPDSSLLSNLGNVMPFSDRTIDLLILTHPHLDHFGSFAAILERYEVKRMMLTGMVYENDLYKHMLELALKRRVEIMTPDPA